MSANINSNNYARDKTKQNSATAAKGAKPHIPVADPYDAWRDGQRDPLPDIARPEHLYGISERVPFRKGRRYNKECDKQ